MAGTVPVLSPNFNIMNSIQLILLSMKVSVILSVFALGLEASLQDVTYLFRHPRKLVVALLPIYIVIPMVAAILISIFTNIHPAAKIALFALSVSPTPPLLPKKQLKAGGTKSYIFGLLVAVSLLAIVVVPLLIEVFERAFKIPAAIPHAVVAQIILTVVLVPLALGIAIRYALPSLAERIGKFLSLIASLFLLIGVLLILFHSIPAMVSLIGNGTIIAIIIFVLIGLGVGHVFGRSDPDNRTALALSTVSRHPGIAITIANINFPEQKLTFAAILLYLLINAVVAIPYLKNARRSK